MTPIIGRRLPFQRSESSGSSPGEVEPRFECPICLRCLEKPVLTSCGHRFCADCIQNWLQKHRTCPIDGRALDQSKDLFPDNYTRREIEQQSVICSYPGCHLAMPLLNYDRHVAEVHEHFERTEPYMYCPFKNIGCHYQFKNPNQLNAHVESLAHHHLQLLASSVESLSLKIPGASMSKDIEAMNWDPPPKEGTPTTESSVQSLIKTLYERVVTLEQKNTEQELQLRKMADQLELMKRAKLKFESDFGLRVCNGNFTWVVPEMESKVRRILMAGNRADELSSILLCSDGFYTSYNGYKFCAKIHVVPAQKHLSLNIHMMKGERDDFLSWPFSGKIVFTLIHPTDADKSVRELICVHHKSSVEAFKRPTERMNKRGFGYTNFIPLVKLAEDGYFYPCGSLKIRIQVEVV